MQEELRLLLAALATAGAVSNAHAVTLGDLQVESALGQRLEARVRVTGAPGETVDARCFSVMGEVPQGLSAVPGLQVTLEPDGQSLRLTSRAPVQEPAAGLALRAACPGAATASVREYVMLLDPLPPGASAVVRARRGETLESLARAMVDKPGPRREYLVAMRAANPALARVGDRDSLDEGTPVVLPDLRPAMRQATAPHASAPASPRASKPASRNAPAAARPSRPPSEELKQATAGEAKAPEASPPMPSAAAEAPAARSATKDAAVRAKPKAERTPPVAPTAPSSNDERPAGPAEPAAPPKRAAAPRSGGFQLKLSSGEVDLAPTTQVSDAQRKQLRERLLVLDADDQVAALLALRHSVQQLESRVAELQLKLAKMPESFPARPATALAAQEASKPAPAPAAATPPTATAPSNPVPVPAPTTATAASPASSPSPASPTPSASPASTPSSASPPASTAAEPPPSPTSPPAATAPAPEAPAPTPAPEAQEKRATKPVPAPIATGAWWTSLPEWAWIAAALLVLLGAWLALRMRRPRDASAEIPPTDLRDAPAEAAAGDMDLELDAPPAPGRAAVDSDAMLATRLGDGDSGNLRRRYIEERFPEVINGTIVLDDPNSVVKGARLFYEDGAMTRAVELLQFAIEEHPQPLATWLALFEIFRLERLSGEYAELALRFQKQHGGSEAWRKVRFFGHEIDPGNPLYRDDAVNTLETIGPREGKRLAASLATVDPIAENWLQAPMDFENEVLANELRNALMARAQLLEQDLVPNPMPALRNVEMFTVA